MIINQQSLVGIYPINCHKFHKKVGSFKSKLVFLLQFTALFLSVFNSINETFIRFVIIINNMIV